ncbi:hypothetical protein IH992_27745 [Candidatus Poribacteria bacterium]|nr:hypothetical protein [Candidatus Poribacteria bacterium]
MKTFEPERFQFTNCLHHTTLVARSSVLRQLGGYKPSLPYAQDYDLFWRLSSTSQIRALPVVLACWRTDYPDSIGIRRAVEQKNCALQISIGAIRDVLTGQSFDEEAYTRFWWACNGHTDRIQRGDVDRLRSLWESLSSEVAIRHVLGPKLIDFAATLLYSHPHEGMQMLRIASRQFGQAILLPRTMKLLLRPLLQVPMLRVWRRIIRVGTQWLQVRI